MIHVLEYDLTVFRRTWRGSLGVSVITPIFFLTAMGLGLGGLVNRGGGLPGVTYLQFLAPGLLAATAMQVAIGEAMFPTMGKVKWMRTYDAMLATPVGIPQIVAGEVAYLGLRLGMVCLIFTAVMAAFGLLQTPQALLAFPFAVLTGLAFAVPAYAFAVMQDTETWFSFVFRFVMMPLFLFSGTFFPLERLPAAIRPLGWLSPLSHGVALTRGSVLGTLGLGEAALHVLVLAALLGMGILAAGAALRRRLVK